ncbi:hypothetical protein [Variovorax durovernensis]
MPSANCAPYSNEVFGMVVREVLLDRSVLAPAQVAVKNFLRRAMSGFIHAVFLSGFGCPRCGSTAAREVTVRTAFPSAGRELRHELLHSRQLGEHEPSIYRHGRDSENPEVYCEVNAFYDVDVDVDVDVGPGRSAGEGR